MDMIRTLKRNLRSSVVTRNAYFFLKSIKEKRIYNNKMLVDGKFIDRSSGSKYLCIVLAGYKEFLYPITFKRLETFAMSGMDICIVTSGKYSEVVAEQCKCRGWSYLSTKENNVALVQNAAITYHPNAEYIFKLDEDIFITHDYFQKMLSALERSKESDYLAGVIAPIIPINAFGHIKILEMTGTKNYYENQFEKPLFIAHPDRQSESNPDVAKFFWGEGGHIPSIDILNEMAEKQKKVESPCAIRFSIGAILFERGLWEAMGGFSVDRRTNNMGKDEEELCTYCMLNSRPILVSENVVVGHLSFGRQNAAMQEYFVTHPEKFDVVVK